MYKKPLFIFLVQFCITHNSFSQFNFQRLIGGPDHDRAQSIFSTFDNGFIVNGGSFSFGIGDVDAVLIKTDNQGQTLWSKAYGTTVYDNSEYSIETFDHNIVCVGRSNLQTGLPTSAIIFKTDSAGNLLWSKSYGGIADDDLVAVIETPDHGYAAVGISQSLSAGSSDILLIRTDINGDTIFTRSFGSVEAETGLNIIQLPDHGYIICGRQTSFSTGALESDGLLLRTDSSGNLLWTKQYGDSLWEELTAVRLLPDSGYIVAGSTVTFGAGSYDILLMKTDGNGDVQWTKTFGGTQTDAAYEIHLNPDDSYVLSGYTESLGYGHTRGDDSSNIFLMKTNATGVLLWMEVYGDGLQDEAFRSSKSSDGGYVIPGFTTDYIFNDSSQMIFIKTDSMGLTGCHEESVQPIDTNITMPYHSVNFIQSSGLPVSNIVLTQINVTPNNDDACLFASVNSNSEIENELKVFPNPFNNHLEISISDYSSADVVNVYDIFGKNVKSIKTEPSHLSIDTEKLSPGIYFIKMNSPGKIVKVNFVIKE